MVDQRKLALVSEMVAQGKISVHAEPRRNDYTQPFEPSEKYSENYFAVYGNEQDIAKLNAHECIVRTDRPGVEYGDKKTKAYLVTGIGGEQLQELCSAQPADELVFGVHEPHARVQALGLLHTDQPCDHAPHEKLSYVAMSSNVDNHFRTLKNRLTDGATTPYARMNHIGREHGELMVLPVRRSMADAIARAHPDALMLSSDKLIEKGVSARSIQEIVMRLHEDERFAVPVPEKKKELVAKAAVQEPTEQTSEPDTLPKLLDELAPHVRGFERFEQIGGGTSSRLVLQMDEGLNDLIRRLNTLPNAGSDPKMFIQQTAGARGSMQTTTITEAAYAVLQERFPTVPIQTRAQTLQQVLVKSVPVALGTDSQIKTRMSISRLRLVRTADEGSIQNWLVVTAPHIKRAELFARRLAIAQEHWRPITTDNEIPAILLLPITPSITEALSSNKTNPIAHEETPYASDLAMVAALREQVGEKNLFTDLQVQEQPSKLRDPATTKTQPSEAAIAEQAGKLLFGLGPLSERLWVHYTERPLNKKHRGKQHPMVSVGIKISGAEAQQFEKDLRETGFLDLTGRDYHHVKGTGEGPSKKYIFQLKIKPSDFELWEAQSGNDAHWPELKDASAGRHRVMLSDEQVQNRLGRFMGNPYPRENPKDTAWRRLAALTNSGAIRCLQVRYSADDIRQMGAVYDKELETINGATAVRNIMEPVRERWKENGVPVYLHPVDDDVNKLATDTRHNTNALQALHEQTEAVKKGRSDFYAWFDGHPKNDDGSVTRQFLAIPNPQSATLRNLRLAEQFNVDEGHDTLFLQKPHVLGRILENGKDFYIMEFSSAFVSQLAEHHGRLESLSEEPVPLSAVDTHLRNKYGLREQDNDVPDPEAAAIDMKLFSQRKARRTLLDRHFPRCRDSILYGQLRPDNVEENLGDRPAHDRIGTQHGLLMHVYSRQQWAETILPMIKTMQEAAFLEAPKSYVMPLGAVKPDVIEAKLNIAQDSLNNSAFADIDYNAQLIKNEFNRDMLRTSIANFIEGAAQLPDDLKPLAAALATLDIAGSDEALQQAAEQINTTKQALRQQVQTLRAHLDDATDKFRQATEVARREGMMHQEKEPLYYVNDDKTGYTFAQLEAVVSRNFNARVRTPMNIVTYLPADGPIKGEYSDLNMINVFKNAPPRVQAHGPWSSKFNSGRVACPTNVTRSQFVAFAAEKVFNQITR